MQVYLKALWFKDGKRYRKSESRKQPTFVPDKYADCLPPSAEVIEGPGKGGSEPDEDEATRRHRKFKEALHRNDGKTPEEVLESVTSGDKAPLSEITDQEEEAAGEDDEVARARALMADDEPLRAPKRTQPARKGRK
jgi:hypothetical protein